MEPVRKSLFAKKSAAAPRSETFAMRVDSYDTKAVPSIVKGYRIDNDEAVTVFLRDIDFNSTGRFKRTEINDFAAPRKDRQHPGTAIGGILLIQEAMPQAPGVFGARWIQSLSHTEGEAEVFVATVHVGPVKRGAGGKDYSLMTLVHDGDFGHLSQEMGETMKLTPPFKVESVDELRDAVTTLLDDGVGVGVRVSNSDNFDAMYVSKRKDMTTTMAVADFMGNIAELTESINSGELTCEVVPYSNMWAGPATTEIMSNNKVVQSRLARFNETAVGANGNVYSVSVFRPAIIAARLTKEDKDGKRAVFFSHFEPLFTRQPVSGLVNAIAHASTEHLAPEPPKPVAQGTAPAAPPVPVPAAIPAARPASAAPEQSYVSYGDFGQFDGGYSDDDLMTAASGGNDIGEEVPQDQHVAPQAAAQPEPEAAAPASTSRRYSGRRS